MRSTQPRHPQSYDPRLRRLIRTTKDVRLGASLGIPSSTLRGWLSTEYLPVVSLDVIDLDTLQAEVVKLRERNQKLAAIIRLPFASAHDLPSALSAMKGGMGGATAKQRQKGIPVIVFHGDQDKTIHPNNGDQVMAQSMRSSGARTSSASVEVQQGKVPNGHAYTRTTTMKSAPRLPRNGWCMARVMRGQAAASGSYTDANGPDATREMMRFFLRNKEAPI